MAIGKITGQMLQSNLDRTGAGDISINANLIYASVSLNRVGIGTASPNYALDVSGNVHAGNLYILGNTITSDSGLKVNLGPITNVQMTGGSPNYIVYTDGSGNLNFGNLNQLASLEGFTGNNIILGTNVLGNLISNAVTMTASTSVTDSIAELNAILGKLVPPSPPNFPASQTLALNSLATYRMTNYTQTDNTGLGLSVSGGVSVSNVLRTAAWSTTGITNTGPGSSGTVTSYLNGVPTGNVTLTGSNSNTTNGNLYVYNVEDYHAVVTTVTAGFWSVFSASASGTSAPQGWNTVKIADSNAGTTNNANWFYDSSSPGTPVVTQTSFINTTNVVIYSSTIPMYTSSAQFTLGFTANRLSGNTYPTTDTFVTGSSGGAFQAPVSVTYETAGITVPLAQNLYVASGTASVSTTTNILASGFGSSSVMPSVSVANSYSSGLLTASLSGGTVLYKNGTSNTIEETSIPVSGSLGSEYSTNAYRIANPDAGTSIDTPAYTGSESAFNSQTSTLYVTDATVVANAIKQDVTNYSSNYYPVGPNLSGHNSSQYFTFKFQRATVSKFDIAITSTTGVAGVWVALPGSTIDTTSGLNGWLTMTSAYQGSGVPGTGTGGNGSNGCAVSGVITAGSALSSGTPYTATFGTVSSTSTATNEIYVRIKLNTGQSLTYLSINTPSH